MKIAPISYGNLFERGEIVGIEKMSITYTQSADTNSDTDDEQYITIETEIRNCSQ